MIEKSGNNSTARGYLPQGDEVQELLSFVDGKESYKVGRYLEPVKRSDGFYTLDFNMCYNPACAYSEHYNCPIPPKENHLTVAIAAGEMDAHYMH